MKHSIQKIIDKYLSVGFPGIQVAIKNAEGLWVLNAGLADPSNNSSFTPSTVSWIYSITKTYTVSLVMKEKQKGHLNLDEPFGKFLPYDIAAHVTGSDMITPRMLMNHTSGLPDFISFSEFLQIQFNHPLQQPSLNELLEMIKNRELLFTPGSDFMYSNTNYLLLQLILENITEKKYYDLLNTEIIQPLGLQNTYIDLTQAQIQQFNFPHYYYDPAATGNLQDVTDWNNALGNASNGWGGIAATATDVLKFYEALMSGKVVSDSALVEMTCWIQGKQSLQPNYGLGLEYFQYAKDLPPQTGHEGDGIGNNTLIFFAPANNIYLYVNITVGRKFGGPFLSHSIDLKNELMTLIAKWKK